MIQSLARHAAFVCLEVKSGMIKSKYFGDSETMVANIFSQAQAIAPCLIWIDEAEKLLGAEESISAQLRKYMTAVRDSGQEVWIVAATNKPWKLSEPIVRRFTNRIYVSLPDKQDALMLLRNSLRSLQQTTTTSGHHPYTLNKGVLGEKLDQLMGKYCSQPQQRYLSCDDVVRSVETIPRALLEELKKSGARPRPFKKQTICGMQHISACKDMTEEGASEKSFSTFTHEENRMTRFRPIDIRDVEVALDEIGDTTTAESIKTFDDWYSAFGTGVKNKKEQKQPKKHPQSLRGNEKADLDLQDCLRGFRGHSRADLARFLFEGLLD